ncbi:MAG TPA: hypothetical protein GX707_16090 [Epulopiscium sp.]|nr:hypothetical protein [Candidatus Epulonipiscium sp.]
MRDEPSKPLKKMEKLLKIFIAWIEIGLAVLVIGAVLISCKDILALIYEVYVSEPKISYVMLQGVLSHILLVVVGLELALMLISHSAANVLEVILYAIARKMLISSTNTMDIVLGVIAITLIFGVDKYLHSQRQL